LLLAVFLLPYLLLVDVGERNDDVGVSKEAALPPAP